MVKACCITVLELKYVAKVFWGWRQLLLSFRIKGYVEMGLQKACHCDCMLQIILDWSVFDANDPKGWRHVVKGFMAEDMFLGYFVSNTCVFTQLGEKTMHNVM